MSDTPPEEPQPVTPPPPEPQSAARQPLPPHPPLPSYQATPGPYGLMPTNGYVEHPQASTAQIMGWVGLGVGLATGIGFLLSPFAWAMGAKAKREIREQGYAGYDKAQQGFVTGIIGTGCLVLTALFFILIIALVMSVPFAMESPGVDA